MSLPKVGSQWIAGQQNLLINGGFRIWQRGTSFSGSDNTYAYTSDKWSIKSVSDPTGSVTVDQSSDSRFGNYSVLFDDQSESGGGYRFAQVVESALVLASQTVTASVWVKEGPNDPANGGRLVIQARDSNGQAIKASVESITSIGSFSRITNTIELPSDTVEVEVNLMSAVDVDGDYDTSQNGELLIDGATLTVGDEPVDYPSVMRPIGQEQSLCERYYETAQNAPGTTDAKEAKVIFNGSSINPAIHFSTEKSAVPTVSTDVINIDEESSSNAEGNWSFDSLWAGAEGFTANYDRGSNTSGPALVLTWSWEAEVT